MADESLVDRAARRVLGAATVSAKIDGEMVARLDARVARIAAEHGRCTRADVIRSALGRYLEAVEAQEPDAGDVIEASAYDISGAP
jgi:metal-responsive CopG/Arc/MetJ family transcriptional regulator